MAQHRPRPEADMLHMQHASVLAVLVRQHDAAREHARRDAIAKSRRAAAAVGAATTEPERSSAPARTAPIRPRPA